jgi:hypothetical protein
VQSCSLSTYMVLTVLGGSLGTGVLFSAGKRLAVITSATGGRPGKHRGASGARAFSLASCAAGDFLGF